MLLCDIWSSVHEKVKQHWGWVKKSVAYKKKRINRIMKSEVALINILSLNISLTIFREWYSKCFDFNIKRVQADWLTSIPRWNHQKTCNFLIFSRGVEVK